MYIVNGTVFLVSDEPEKFPDIQMVTSSASPVNDGGLVDMERHIPTDNEMRIISTKEAKGILGEGADIMDGVTVSSNYFRPCLSLTFFV